MAWTPDKVVQALNVSQETAERIIGLVHGTIDYKVHPAVVRWAEQCYHDPRESSQARAECVMEAINAELGGYGVEAIRGRYVDRYHDDCQATYVNMGDTYAGTVLYDNERQRYRLTTMGDWVEKYGDRREVA